MKKETSTQQDTLQLPSNVKILGPTGSYQMFGPNGTTMVPNYSYQLEVGTKVYASGPGCDDMWFVVTESSETSMTMVSICPADYDKNELCRFDVERYWSHTKRIQPADVRPISQKFGIGLYFDESGEMVSEELIQRSIQRAKDIDEYEAKLKAHDNQKKQELQEKYVKEYAHLTLNKESNHKIVGQNIRADLKHHFPGHKFSVTSTTSGNGYYINWEDGPTADEVVPIVDKYRCYHSDWTGDYYDYTPSTFNEMFGGVKYIDTKRHITKEVKELICREFAWLTEDNKHTTDNEEVRECLRMYPQLSVNSILLSIADKRSYYKPREVAAKTAGNIEMRDYIILLGNSKPIKEELKALGATFNPHLSCGAGWILPVSKKEAALSLSKEIAAVNLIALFGDTKAIKNELRALGAIFSPYLVDGAGWAITVDKKEAIQKLIEP